LPLPLPLPAQAPSMLIAIATMIEMITLPTITLSSNSSCGEQELNWIQHTTAVQIYHTESNWMTGTVAIGILMGTSKNDATDVKLGRSRGSRGSGVGFSSGFSVFSGPPAGLFATQCGLQADVSPDDRHVGTAAARRSSWTRRRML
jgi:hypothetical protein